MGDVSDGGSDPEIITRTYRVTDVSGNTTDVQQTITVSSFGISTQPTDQTVIVGYNGVFTVTGNNTDTYQWEVSTNGGGTFNPISDGTDYAGTQTSNLTLITPGIDKNGYVYRVLVTNSSASCSAVASNQVLLQITVGTAITNRRITYRVHKGNP